MKSELITQSKINFDTLDPKMDDIVIGDIAHALSMVTRANGHYPEFFSVGQHSIQCCREAMARSYIPEVSLACLLHDASDAYLSAITRSVKKNMTIYRQVEENLQDVIYRKFLGYVPQGEQAQLVDNIDDTCLYYEFKHFMGMETLPIAPLMVGAVNYQFQPMSEVEEEFLELYRTLMTQMNR